jgi:hypothetical protein
MREIAATNLRSKLSFCYLGQFQFAHKIVAVIQATFAGFKNFSRFLFAFRWLIY